MTTRPIPASGEALPVVGCGTYIGFDHDPASPAYALPPGVVSALLDAGGTVLDSHFDMPFGGGGLLRQVLGKPLPPWAGEIGCAGWPQILLKFVLSQPAVTCVIPGTRRREHMADNAVAGFGSVPEPSFWPSKIDAILA